MLKRWMLVLSMALLFLLSALPAYAAPSVEMKAEVAGGGRARFGGWVTISVDLVNQGGEVAAELIATQTDGPEWERAAEYVVPLTLPAGARKRVPMYVPIFNGGGIAVRLRAGGVVIQEQTLNAMTLSPDSLFAGVLSDDELGVPALSRLGGGRQGASQVARLGPESLPASASLLEAFDVIALVRFNTAVLSRDQLQALEAWVGRGGTLLLAGGPEWKRTLTGVPESLVPVTVTGVREADLAALEPLAGKPIGAKAPVSDGRALRGQVLAAAGDTPLIVVDRVGTGKVIYLAADPSLEPLAGWAGLPDLLDRVLGVRTQDNFHNRSNLENMMMNALQQMPGLGLPSAALLGSLLGGYLILVGPVSYWILKRKDRREWLWITVPVLSLTFVGAVYAAGIGKQYNMLSHLITVTELSPGTASATSTAYVGVYAPSHDRLSVDLGAAPLVRPLATYTGRTERTARVIRGDRTTVQLLDLNNYSMQGFSVEQDAAVKGGLQITDFAVNESGNLTGKVINRLDRPVRDLQVSAGGAWQSLGSIEPGQTTGTFTLDLAQANLGPKGMMGPRFFGMEPGAVDPSAQSVMGAVFGWEGEWVRSGAILLAGWTDEPIVAPAVPELGRMQKGANLVYASAPIPVDPARGEVPPGVVVGVHSGGPGYGRVPYGYSLNQGAHTFSMMMPLVDPARVAEVKLHAQVLGSTRGYTLAVKNQKTGEWSALENLAIQPLQGWQNFVGAGGLVEIRVDVAEHAEMAPPSLSVKGVAR